MIVLSASGCKKHEGCTQFGTENYDPDAIIDDGSCILARDKFLGTFTVQSSCQNDTYQSSVEATSDDFTVVITNLADSLGAVEAKIAAENITIEQQPLNAFVTIEGAGVYLDSNIISISYRIRDMHQNPTLIYDCLETFTKQ